MTTDNIKPKGGRGKRADYVTVQVRCPEPIKQAVTQLINQWHLGETNSQLDQQKNLNTTIEKLTLELKQEKAWVEALKESHKRNEAVRDETLGNLAAELGNAEREIKRLTELNQNLNTTIEELKQQNLNTGINPEAINVLENALTLKANAGGKIKDAIKQALKLLK